MGRCQISVSRRVFGINVHGVRCLFSGFSVTVENEFSTRSGGFVWSPWRVWAAEAHMYKWLHERYMQPNTPIHSILAT
jgi:hypothetical protein